MARLLPSRNPGLNELAERVRGIIGARGSARALLDAARAAAPEIGQEFPPLGRVIDQLCEMLEPVAACEDPSQPESIDALRALAELYMKWDRLLEAAAVLREGQLSARCRPDDRIPGAVGRWRRRELAADSSMDRIRTVRNDLLHAGFNDQPSAPRDIRRRLEEELPRLVPLGASGPSATEDPGPFINLSNHPSAGWAEPQRAAALAMGSPILDVPFPRVEPAADIQTLEALAEQVRAAVPDTARHAMVMGEMGLTVAIVQQLQATGVRCYAATTERSPDRAAFDFVRFREYPRIG